MQRVFSVRLLTALAVLLAPAMLIGAEKRKPVMRITKSNYNPDHETVELFEAIESGKIEATLVVKSSKECSLLIDNKTDKPLNVKLPEAFVGVLAQFDAGGGDPFGDGGGGGQNQQFGGGFGGGGGGGGFGGGGFGNVPPEKVGQIKAAGVCLEHGKKEPRPSVKYVIKPVEAVSSDPALKEMLRLFANKKINQRVAQAAAWHLNSKMSWRALAAKRINRVGLRPKPYFNQGELAAAMRLVAVAEQAARDSEKPESTSPGERASLK